MRSGIRLKVAWMSSTAKSKTTATPPGKPLQGPQSGHGVPNGEGSSIAAGSRPGGSCAFQKRFLQAPISGEEGVTPHAYQVCLVNSWDMSTSIQTKTTSKSTLLLSWMSSGTTSYSVRQ